MVFVMPPIDITDNESTLSINLRIQVIYFLSLGLTICTQACLDTGTEMATVYVFFFFFVCLFYKLCQHKHGGNMPSILPKRWLGQDFQVTKHRNIHECILQRGQLIDSYSSLKSSQIHAPSVLFIFKKHFLF